MCRVHRYRDAGAFLDRAEGWLLEAEAEHNLLLGLARRLCTSAEAYTPPIYLATVEQEGHVAGCAFRTPPYKFGLTRMPAEALPALVEDVAGVYDALPAVLGPEPVAQAFARAWSRKRGIGFREGMRQRIYQLDEVIPPVRVPPGHLRAARPADLALIVKWAGGFAADAGVLLMRPRQRAEELIAQQDLKLWEDERPVSMAAAIGRTPNGVRIGYVYTPPELRRRGYATACAAALSAQLLRDGNRFCFLYTDLSNPTSNSIYRQIGYRPVCDVVDYHFF